MRPFSPEAWNFGPDSRLVVLTGTGIPAASGTRPFDGAREFDNFCPSYGAATRPRIVGFGKTSCKERIPMKQAGPEDIGMRAGKRFLATRRLPPIVPGMPVFVLRAR